MVSPTGKRVIPSRPCKAASAHSKLVCAKRRAPTTTESKNAVKVSTGSMALGEVRRNGRCCFTASLAQKATDFIQSKVVPQEAEWQAVGVLAKYGWGS